MDLHLLLARADDHRPVLADSLKLESVLREPPPSHVKTDYLYEHHGDLNDLRVQGWAVVAPTGERGEQALARVAPLIRHRAEQQRLAPEQVKLFRVEPGAALPQAEALRSKLLKMPWEEQPRYLLLLGDADELSFEFQQALTVDRFVGRLAFARESDLEAYVDKVLRSEKEPPRAELARALFFSVHDRTPATSIGYEMLISPGLRSCRRSFERGNLPAREVRELGTPEDWHESQLLSSVAEPVPSVLLTLSHGLGAPWGGWKSVEEQRRRQGAMSLGSGKELKIEDVTGQPFLPGGLWFYFACLSAGTPARSLFSPWLRRLKEEGEGSSGPEAVLSSAPVDGRAFVAALPQAALANPDGPLAVIGHVDLAWMYSFLEPSGQSHATRFSAVMADLVKHRRAGVGLNVLSSAIASVDAKLAMLHHQDAALGSERGAPLEEEYHRAHLWMTRHDLAGYVLLGDPAVRLPINGPAL